MSRPPDWTSVDAPLGRLSDGTQVEQDLLDLVPGREDRVDVLVLPADEPGEVLRAVGRPARPDEQRDVRELVQEQPLQLLGDLLLLRRVEGALELVQQRGCLRI